MEKIIYAATDLTENSLATIQSAIYFGNIIKAKTNIFYINKISETEVREILFPEFKEKSQEINQTISNHIGKKVTEQINSIELDKTHVSIKMFTAQDESFTENFLKTTKLDYIFTVMAKNHGFRVQQLLSEDILKSSSKPVIAIHDHALTKLDTICVPFAFQGMSLSALKEARDLAKYTHCKLIFVHTLNEKSTSSDSLEVLKNITLNKNEEQHKSSIIQFFEEIDSSIDFKIEFTNEGSHKQEALNDYINAITPDLIIMGSSLKNSFEKYYLGSFSEYILRHSKYPLMICKS